MKRLYFTLCFLLALCGGSFLQAQSSCLEMKGAHLAATTGSTACMDITANNFVDIVGMQFTMFWDAEVLSFKEIQNIQLNSGTINNFGTPSQIGYPDRLTVFWTPSSTVAQTLPDGSVIFTLCFDVIGSTGDFSLLSFGTVPTAVVIVSRHDPSGTFPEVAAGFYSGSVIVGNTPGDVPLVASASCPQSSYCSEVPPAGIETLTSGGTPPYAYAWSGPDGFSSTEPTITDLAPGTYSLMVTDAAGLANESLFFAPGTNSIELSAINITPPAAAPGKAMVRSISR